MVELEDFKYGGTNITAFRLVNSNDEKVTYFSLSWRSKFASLQISPNPSHAEKNSNTDAQV